MLEYKLRYELMEQLNLIKSLLGECVISGEISQGLRIRVMGEIGQIKQLLYTDDLVFKSVYQKAKERSM